MSCEDHQITPQHALIPGATIGHAVREGYGINVPERGVPGSSDVAPLVTVHNEAVVMSAVKLADDASGDVVVRCYESLGGRAEVRLDSRFALTGAQRCDLLERPLDGQACDPDGTGVRLRLRPFELVTLRLARASKTVEDGTR
ncbi:glycosyl hydrolase-related protein [Actinokineospora xionganensis]|nr:glycosyl hydrolase-related protein [Actinokineospora xionganensis]